MGGDVSGGSARMLAFFRIQENYLFRNYVVALRLSGDKHRFILVLCFSFSLDKQRPHAE
jgi:hypothetical protein